VPFPLQAARIHQSASVNRQILRAVATVSGAGLIVKLAATLKEFAVAAVYGRSDAMDAFLAAYLIPGLLINLVAESMNQALVPTLVRVREHDGQERAQQLLSSCMAALCLLLAVVAILMLLGARAFFPLIASHYAPAKLDLAIHLFDLLVPVILITGIAANCAAVLNTCERFALPALAPVAVPVAVMLCAWLLNGRIGIWALAAGTLAGAIAQAGVVVAMMHTHGYRFDLRWCGATQETREVTRQYWPIFFSSIVASGGLLVDQSMAAMLSAGSVSSLAYAGRFVSVILTLLAGAVSTAIAPYFSQMIANHDWAGCRHTLLVWTGATALVSTPIALGLIACAHGLVRAAFQHGAFGPGDTAVVAPVLVMYAFQIPFIVTSRVSYRFLVAMRRNDLVLWCGIVNLALDVILNLVLMRRFGVAGIALSTSLWAASTFFFLWFWAWKLLPRPSHGATA
jgi:putative peptidoglycan lipid II flippase